MQEPMDRDTARVKVLLPKALSRDWKVSPALEAHGRTLAEAFADLNARVPGLAGTVLDDQGRVRRFVLVFVNHQAVTHLDPAAVPLAQGDIVHVLPNVAGG
jgi:molybdopterin synthase sulfur carrier subunit